MNMGCVEVDLWGGYTLGIDKTFVIQNLFQRPQKDTSAGEIFLNYSLDTKLSPPAAPSLA